MGGGCILERYVEPPKGGVVRNVKPDPLDSQTDAEALNLEDPVRRGVALRGCGWMRSELRRVVAVNGKSQREPRRELHQEA